MEGREPNTVLCFLDCRLEIDYTAVKVNEVHEDVEDGRLQNMCDVMDRAEKIGGDKREAEINERVAVDMLKEGDAVEKISRISKLSVEKIKKLADKLGIVAAL